MKTICPLCSAICPDAENEALSPVHQAACRRCGVTLVIVTKPVAGEVNEERNGNGAAVYSSESRALTSTIQAMETTQIRCQSCQTAHVFSAERLCQPLVRGRCRKCTRPFVFVSLADTEPRPTMMPAPAFETSTIMVAVRDVQDRSISRSTSRRLSFYSSGGALFGLQVVNVLLTVVTFGIYHFWAKTKIRHYLWSQCEFEGDRFAYHGTGMELCAGWARAFVVFGLPIIGLGVVRDVLDVDALVKTLAAVLASGISVAFLPVAMVGARRYRLSRTSWRGIAFSFRGRAIDFLKLFLKGWGLTALTLGLYYPIFDAKRHGFLLSHSYFGHQPFAFDGKGCDLFWSYVAMLGLFPITLGIAWIWYLAKKQVYFWEHTSLASARFRYTATWPRLLALKVGNALLLILTAGLAWPWVTVRNLNFNFQHLTCEGLLDLDAIRQEPQTTTAAGEGIASFFDFLDGGFDLG